MMSSVVHDFKDLFVWKQSMKLTASAYAFCRELPMTERYGLSSQIQRAAVSIPSNIAEGHSRSTRKDYIHFLYIARGSAAELETQILLCEQLFGHQKSKELLRMISDTRRLLSLLISSLK